MTRRSAVPPENDLAQWLAKQGDLTSLKQLAKEGGELDKADDKGDTPLLYAVFSCHRPVWEWLLDQGANIRHANAKGDTVLHHIARRFKSGDDALDDLRTLVERGADINAANHGGYTPILQEAARDQASQGKKQPRMAHLEWLIEQGADPLAVTGDGETLANLMGPEAYPLIAHHRQATVNDVPESIQNRPSRPRIRT